MGLIPTDRQQYRSYNQTPVNNAICANNSCTINAGNAHKQVGGLGSSLSLGYIMDLISTISTALSVAFKPSSSVPSPLNGTTVLYIGSGATR